MGGATIEPDDAGEDRAAPVEDAAGIGEDAGSVMTAPDAGEIADAHGLLDAGGRGWLDAAGPSDAGGEVDDAPGSADAGRADAGAAEDAGPLQPDAGASGGDAAFDSSVALGGDASADANADAACAPSTSSNDCAALSALAADPIIDGVLDCGPALVALSPEGWNGLASLPAGNSASIAVGWRPTGLYVFVQVTTPAVIPADPGSPPYDGAGIELFVDSDGAYPNAPQYDDPGTIQLVCAAPSGAAPAAIGEGYRNASDQGPWTSSKFATFPSAGGFVFEAFVVASDLGLSSWTLSPGNAVGFDLAVDVSYANAATTGAQGHRAGQYFLNVGSAPIGAPYDDPRAFCSPELN